MCLVEGTLPCFAQPPKHPSFGGLAREQPAVSLVRAVQLADSLSVAPNSLAADAVEQPKLQPISRTLARDMQQTQRLRKQLQQDISYLEHQLLLASGEGAVHMQLLPITTSREAAGLVELSEDPLFCLSTPPSYEQLQRRLVKVRSQLKVANSGMLADVLTGRFLSMALPNCCEGDMTTAMSI